MAREVLLRPGERVQEFVVVRELGAGGFGVTYLARDVSFERLVALKEYFPVEYATRRSDGKIGPRSQQEVDGYRWGLKRFLREAWALDRLAHPNIVRVRRVFEGRGTAYLVTEYVEGRSLHEELGGREGKAWPEARVRSLMEGLVDGLAHVHAADLVHRDIKPANVMVRADGTPVLIDFGAAKSSWGTQTKSTRQTFSEGYSAIEQYGSESEHGPATDVYALGAVAYRALTGRRPDAAPDRVSRDPLVDVRQAARGAVSAEFGAAVMAALAVREEGRPRSVSAWRALWDVGATGPAHVTAEVERHDVSAADPPVVGSILGLTPGSGTDPEPSGSHSDDTRSDGRWKRRLWRLGLGTALVVILLSFVFLAYVGYLSYDPLLDEAMDRNYEAMMTESSLGLDRETRRLIQQGLAAEGFDPGETHGLFFGDFTRRAVIRWQMARGAIEPTGYLDADDVDDLVRRALQPGRRFSDCEECPLMVVVPPGSFLMGSPPGEAGRDDFEAPRHEVRIANAFAVGVYEVTFSEWAACLDAGGCRGYDPGDSGWGRGERPVIHVAWVDVQAYVEWLSRETEAAYRLPSEAEWEYVARAGTTTSRYWGDDVSAQCVHANGADRNPGRYREEFNWGSGGVVAPCDDGEFGPAPVGSYAPNDFGLHDVLGNVWEFTADCWHETYAGAPVDGRVWAGGDCDRHVIRGGSWFAIPDSIRIGRRRYHYVGVDPERDVEPRGYFDAGFRVARVLQ